MHVTITIYSVCCIFASLFYFNGSLTTILLLQLFFIQQYFYYCLFLEKKVEGGVVFCVDCDKMTNDTFIHCKQCQKCVPVTHFHWIAIDTCVSNLDAKRYSQIVRLVIGTNLVCSMIESIRYLPFIFITFLSAIVFKSTVSKFNLNI